MEQGGGTGAVAFADDERGGQATLPVEANAGVGQGSVGRGRIIGEQCPERGFIVACCECCPQSLLGADDFGPRVVQQPIGDAVDAGRKRTRVDQ